MKHFLFILLCLLFSSAHAEQPISLPPKIIQLAGNPAPPLKLSDMDDNLYDISKAKGRWVFVHFWATWCGPCRKEIPAVNAVAEKFKGTKLDIIVINTAESEDIIFNFLGIVAPDLVYFRDADGQVTEQWQPRGLPATYFVDPKGKLQYVALGGRPWTDPQYLSFLNTLENKAEK